MPISNVAAGAGKHVRYDAVAPYEVVTLNALANDRMHISEAPYVRFALARVREELPKWQRRAHKAKQAPPLFLVIKRPMSQATALDPTADVVSKIDIHPTTETMHVVSLHQLFQRIHRAR